MDNLEYFFSIAIFVLCLLISVPIVCFYFFAEQGFKLMQGSTNGVLFWRRWGNVQQFYSFGVEISPEVVLTECQVDGLHSKKQ